MAMQALQSMHTASDVLLLSSCGIEIRIEIEIVIRIYWKYFGIIIISFNKMLSYSFNNLP